MASINLLTGGKRCIIFEARERIWKGGDIMPGIKVREDEPFEKALKRFNKTCEKAGILSEIRKHQHFEKPSERRKRKLNVAKRRNRRGRS